MDVITYQQASKIFMFLNGKISEKDELILCYDEHDDRITASACYSYSDLA